MGLIYSILFGLYQVYDKGWETNWFHVALVGFAAGCIAGLIAYEKSRKFTEERPLMVGEVLVEEGFAACYEISGWFYLTNTRFFFITSYDKPTIRSPFKPSGETLSIPLSEIVSAETEYKLGIIPKKMILTLKNGTREEFAVDNTKHLVKQINRASGLLLKAPRNFNTYD